MNRLRLGTRRSPLAMWQANWAATALAAAHPDVAIEIVPVESDGDVDLTTPLVQLGTVGIFTQTLERRLLDDAIDVAVHSLKDVPAQTAPGLVLSAHSPREDRRDVWFHRDGRSIHDAPTPTRVATGSVRRRSQLLTARSDFQMVDLRGNLQTRWEKFEAGTFDAMVLAAAGVCRLGWEDRVTEWVDPGILLPAVGQGIIGLQTRADDPAAALVGAVDDAPAASCARAERALLAEVAGGCVVPLGGLATLADDEMTLRARLSSPDGRQVIEESATGPTSDADSLGRSVGRRLRERGGDAIVEQAKGEIS